MARQLKLPEIRRIERLALRQSEKYGFDFPANLASKLKRLSVQELKGIHAKELRERYGTFETESGDTVTAQQEFKRRQNERRRELRNKASRQNEYKDMRYADYDDSSASFVDNVLTGIEEEIDKNWDSSIPVRAYGARLLKTALQNEINKYGRNKVARACEESASVAKRSAEGVIYDSEQGRKTSSLMSFMQIITGVAISSEEAKQIEDAQTMQDYYEELEDED